MCKWIDVNSKMPPINVVVVGMATTPDFSGKAFPAMVGLDATRGWVTWPSLELCYVFYWKRLTSPAGHTFKLFADNAIEPKLGEENAEDTIVDNPSNGH